MHDSMTETPDTLSREDVLRAASGLDSGKSATEQDPPEQRAAGSDDQPEPQQELELEQEPEQTAPEPEPEKDSRYKRALKAQQRAAEQWKKLQAEKAALQKEQEQLARQRQELEQRQSQPSFDDRFSPEDYLEIAKTFEEEGDEKAAEVARKQAERVREHREQLKLQRHQQELAQEWNRNLEAAVKQHPDLGNKESDLFKYTAELLHRKPYLAKMPNGITDAVEAATLYLKSKNATNLATENQELKQKLEKLQQKLQVDGGKPTAAFPAERSFDELPADQQRDYILRMAKAADAA